MKVIIVLPAYNAEKTIKDTVLSIPKNCYDKLILCDDGSTDKTVDEAKKLGIEVLQHTKNLGYGANQKTLYAKALEYQADIVIMLHPDYQYDPRIIPYMIGFIKENICDVVLGNRIRTRKEALFNGMPLWKYLLNRISSMFENIIFGQNLAEWHSGLRAYSRKVLETIPWENNSNDFVFDQQMLIQCVFYGFRIGDVPVVSKYFKYSSSINFYQSIKYGIGTFVTIIKYFLTKAGIIKSKLFFKQ